MKQIIIYELTSIAKKITIGFSCIKNDERGKNILYIYGK